MTIKRYPSDKEKEYIKENQEIMRKDVLCKTLGISYKTLLKWIDEGLIQHIPNKKRKRKIHKFNCGFCGKEIIRHKALYGRKETFCSTECIKNYRSKRMSGENNNFFGKNHSEDSKNKIRSGLDKYRLTEEYKNREFDLSHLKEYRGNFYYKRWIELYGEEGAKIKNQERIEKLRIASTGESNPMYGKPSPKGSGNGWKGRYKGHYFRSLRELNYLIYLEDKNWISAEGKQYRIIYEDYLGQKRSYFADFIVENKYLVECKPQRLHESPQVLAKSKAAREYCKENNLEYVLIDPGIPETSIMVQLYDSGDLEFESRYLDKFLKYYEDYKDEQIGSNAIDGKGGEDNLGQ